MGKLSTRVCLRAYVLNENVGMCVSVLNLCINTCIHRYMHVLLHLLMHSVYFDMLQPKWHVEICTYV
jgi:hypothetical protein